MGEDTRSKAQELNQVPVVNQPSQEPAAPELSQEQVVHHPSQERVRFLRDFQRGSSSTTCLEQSSAETASSPPLPPPLAALLLADPSPTPPRVEPLSEQLRNIFALEPSLEATSHIHWSVLEVGVP